MILRSLPTLCRAVTACGLGLMLAACSSTKKTADTGGKISKVKYYHLSDQKRVIVTTDPSVLFEQQHFLHGAVSNKERLERQGHYYAVMWKVTDRTQPVKVRLEYRQQKTGLAVKSQEQEVSKIDRNNITRFEVIGSDYADHGAVTSWRALLLRGKQVLAEEKSYLWE